MASRIPSRALLSLFLVTGACAAQGYTPPPPPLTVDPCAVQPNPKIPVAPDPKAKPLVCPPPAPIDAKPAAPAGGTPPSAADQFPFPGSAPAPQSAKPSTADQFPFPGSAPPTPPAVPAKKGSPADQFPYPGETSQSPDAVPEGNTPRYVPDSPAPGTSGSSPSSDDGSSSSSSSKDSLPIPEDDRPASTDAPNVKKGRRALPKVSAQSLDERVTEDLNVAKFYSGRGNYQAAYLRSKDATTLMPDDAESHFLLAQAAEKLKKNDEAIAEYKLYLKLDPGGNGTKVAEKAIAELR